MVLAVLVKVVLAGVALAPNAWAHPCNQSLSQQSIGNGLYHMTRGQCNWEVTHNTNMSRLKDYAAFTDVARTFTAQQTFEQETEDAGPPVILKRKSDTENALEYYDTTNNITKMWIDAYGQVHVGYGLGDTVSSAIMLGQRGDVIYSDGVGGDHDTYIGRTGQGVLSVGDWGNGGSPGIRISNDGAASGYGSGFYYDGFLQIDGDATGTLSSVKLVNRGEYLGITWDDGSTYPIKITTTAVQDTAQTLTCANNGTPASKPTCTLTPTSRAVKCNCNDSDGCNIQVGEASAYLGQTVIIMVRESAYNCSFADVAGSVNVASTFDMGAGTDDLLEFVYNEQVWAELKRQDY